MPLSPKDKNAPKESNDVLGALLTELRAEAGLAEAATMSDEHKAEIVRVADAIQATLARNGIKRVRVVNRGDNRQINVGAKSIPNVPENLVQMANMVMEPLVTMLTKMGGEVRAPLPGGTRYITMPSGIRVIGGVNTNSKAVLINIVEPAR